MDISLFLDSVAKQNQNGYQTLLKNIKAFTDSKNYIAPSLGFSNLSQYYANLPLSDNELHDSKLIISTWTYLEVARAYFLIKIADKFKQEYVDIIDQLFDTAGLSELIALYKILPLLPEPEKFLSRATEGVRTNMTSVFYAIALNNVYPMKYFDQATWNQMILKVFFIEGSINQVIGLKERTNNTLAGMLIDFANERKVAKRQVTPELWQVVELCQDDK